VAGVLEGLLTRPSDLFGAQAAAAEAVVVNVGPDTGLVLLPVTEHVHSRLDPGPRTAAALPGFYRLGPGLADWARRLSSDQPVCYVHMEFHGGTGLHAAVGWHHEQLRWGPRFTTNNRGDADEHYEYIPDDRRGDMAVNAALRWLGVQRGTAIDEFAAADLTRHRFTEEWS
jgi:hypothetical protein